jgi:hypothetical protein
MQKAPKPKLDKEFAPLRDAFISTEYIPVRCRELREG